MRKCHVARFSEAAAAYLTQRDPEPVDLTGRQATGMLAQANAPWFRCGADCFLGWRYRHGDTGLCRDASAGHACGQPRRRRTNAPALLPCQ